jgi:hypothetical protein
MILYIQDNRCVEVNNDEKVILSFDELEILTGSKKLKSIMSKRINKYITLRRGKNNRLTVMDVEFILYQDYIDIDTNIKYKCVKLDHATDETVMRNTTKRSKINLRLTKSVDRWMIDK